MNLPIIRWRTSTSIPRWWTISVLVIRGWSSSLSWGTFSVSIIWRRPPGPRIPVSIWRWSAIFSRWPVSPSVIWRTPWSARGSSTIRIRSSAVRRRSSSSIVWWRFSIPSAFHSWRGTSARPASLVVGYRLPKQSFKLQSLAIKMKV